MMAVKARTKKWGNSLGIVIPKDSVQSENLKPGEEVELVLIKKTNVLKETFGMLKGKLRKSTDEMLRETDRELWGIDRKG
ncbi:AbrB/MazE/SpoVT family DNA-binding domain-containing protein [Candidatus Woesearchaeota archaeon]|nr:AbrB/MazE/SpoVT family DNA-binding domain-containing protein [Candidatus Woesearchaeota archaeon]MBI2575296.1 AbrB/MazE/SpoVT family DNA-binding domain-containing protein [Candidatus Woesearchaeota archaeon]